MYLIFIYVTLISYFNYKYNMDDKNDNGMNNYVWRTLGASNHSSYEREEYDYYATEPYAAQLLMEVETFGDIWECACR